MGEDIIYCIVVEQYNAFYCHHSCLHVSLLCYVSLDFLSLSHPIFAEVCACWSKLRETSEFQFALSQDDTLSK